MMSVVLVCFLQILAAQAPSASVVGRWRSLQTSAGGIGSMLEFRKDGTVASSPGAVVEGSYRIENNELVLPAGTQGGAEQRMRIEWMNRSSASLTS
jgi:hypothetical protein